MSPATTTTATPADTIIARVPCPGFYDSLLSGELDHVEEREAEHFADERQEEDGIPAELRLSQDDVASILFDVTDYRAAHNELAADYAASFAHWLDERLSFKTGLVFESMDSPREYNFTTDRLYMALPVATAEALLAMSAADGHKHLAERLADTFTSRSGFISGYSNDVEAWLETPVAEWDHNELCSLIEACAAIHAEPHEESLDWQIYYMMADGEAFYTAHSNAVDWNAFDSKVQDKRDELAEEHRADVDPDYIAPPVRCSMTLDMFNGLEG